MCSQRQKIKQEELKGKTRHPGNLVLMILTQSSALLSDDVGCCLVMFLFSLSLSLVVFFYVERLPLHHGCFCFLALMPLKRGWYYQKHANMDFHQHFCTPPLCYLSFPFQFQLDINPTREHKKWVKSPIYGQTPFRRDFGCRQSTDLHMCKGERLHESKRDCMIEQEREREREKLFFSLVLNWFCCLLPGNHNPLWKALFLAQNITKDIFTFCLPDTLINNGAIVSILEKTMHARPLFFFF